MKSLPKNIKCLCFDLDNTLIDRNKAYSTYLEKAFEFVNQPKIWAENKTRILEFDNKGYKSREIFYQWLISEFMHQKLFEEFQKKYVVGDFVEKVDTEIITTLMALKEHYHLVLLTNGGNHNQQKKIVNSGLYKIFPPSSTFISGDYSFEKPNPMFFKLIQMQYGYTPDEIVMIGDDYDKDIVGAHQLGWPTIHLNEKKIDASMASVQIKNIQEIALYL
ncbi:HAD family hydrolase [Flammeovirga aprica]|uniref:HAD family hydrolase n=1 Tax=Flammeovirga aprica JL-4 TaxID=694437 RepID=A0A7X9XA95_9BACT|nr:HAD family hydrolase [Flammeovirga aprica]NME69447.1 HAD family hydrolase [Flammeovirga aprica JL-4]